MAGEVDTLKGKIREVAGAATDDKSTENEGKLDQANGHLKGAAENIKERAKEALGRATDKAKDASEKAEESTRRDPDHDDSSESTRSHRVSGWREEASERPRHSRDAVGEPGRGREQ